MVLMMEKEKREKNSFTKTSKKDQKGWGKNFTFIPSVKEGKKIAITWVALTKHKLYLTNELYSWVKGERKSLNL